MQRTDLEPGLFKELCQLLNLSLNTMYTPCVIDSIPIGLFFKTVAQALLPLSHLHRKACIDQK